LSRRKKLLHGHLDLLPLFWTELTELFLNKRLRHLKYRRSNMRTTPRPRWVHRPTHMTETRHVHVALS